MTLTTLTLKSVGCQIKEKRLFADISLQLAAGEGLFVQGGNGTGKSSLLRLLTGLTTPSEGEIYWENQLIQSLGPLYWDRLHYISHLNGIKLGLTVKENVEAMGFLAHTYLPCGHESLLKAWQLTPYLHTLATHLSAGLKRRLALIKLLLFPKTVWILDEPCTALDSATQTLFLTALKNHLSAGGLAVVSSHQPIYLPGIRLKSIRLPAC